MPDLNTVAAFLDDRHRSVAASAAEVAREIARLEPAETDAAARVQSRQLVRLMGRAGLYRHAFPESVGGAPDGPDFRSCCLIRETLAAASPLADSVFALQCLGSTPLVLAGSEELKREVLPKVISGQWMAAFAMTEPEAGSDVASLSTRAERDGDQWVLNGRKHLITNAGEADFYCVFATTDPSAGARGLGLFFVEADRPGLRFVAAQVLSEPHPLGEIELADCRVPAAHHLGVPGQGFKVGMKTLDRLRPTVAAAACGMAERALEEALTHARSRRQFAGTLSDLPMIQQKLARMATDLAASRLLTYRAAAATDGGAERITLEAAMAKSFATEAAQGIVDDAVQILGGRGCLSRHPVDRLYRAVRALRIYEGATEVQHLVIARQVLAQFDARA